MVRHPFDNLSRIPGIPVPLIVFHAEQDGVIPVAHGRAVLAAAPGPKTGVFMAGGAHPALLNDRSGRAVAALVSFDTPNQALIAAGGFFVINMIESNLVTPAVLGRRLPLNVVALFVGLLFWGWIWGITGAVLAVPLTVMLKIICDHVEGLEKVAVFLDS